MAVYEFKGFDESGKAVKGARDAESAKGLRASLRREGIMATEVNASGKDQGGKRGRGATDKGSALSKDVEFTFLQRISTEEIGIATRQLATLLQAGVTMVESLTAIIDQIENKAFKRIFSQIKEDVNGGASLADSMAKHKCFDHVFVNMVRAGESSGTLDLVLERLADFKEGQARLKGEIMGTMMYPIIMVFVGVGILGVLFTVVVPRITRIFEHANAQLPIMTRILIGVSNLARDYWWLGFVLMIGTVLLTRRWLGTEAGRSRWDRISLRLPLFGNLIRMIAVSRFARTLGTLLNSGVSLLVSLEIVKNVVANTVIAKAVDDTKIAVREGEDIATPLRRSDQFPPMLVHMVAIGEKSGQLESMLTRVAVAFEHRVETRLKTMTSLLEPLMILGMASIVGFIVFSILMPILQMNTLVR
jgi:general secretion pathway protein F